MQPPLTDFARITLDHAQTEARALNQEFVGTEHLALAILESRDCLAALVMNALQVDREAVRSKLFSFMPGSKDAPVITGMLPLSPKAQRAVNSAIVIAQSLRDAKISTRVLMLALMQESVSPFVDALRDSGVDIDALLKALAEKPVEPEL